MGGIKGHGVGFTVKVLRPIREANSAFIESAFFCCYFERYFSFMRTAIISTSTKKRFINVKMIVL